MGARRPRVPATRGRAHLPRTWEAAAEAGRSRSGCGPCGPPAGLRLGGHVALASKGRILGLPAHGVHTPGLRRTGRIPSESAPAAARRPPAPGGALGAAWPPVGALRAGRAPRLLAPSPALQTQEGERRVSLGRPGSTAARSPPVLSCRLTCSSGLGTRTLLFQKPARVLGKGVEAQAWPVGAGASSASNLGSGFTSAWLSPKGGETTRGPDSAPGPPSDGLPPSSGSAQEPPPG